MSIQSAAGAPARKLREFIAALAALLDEKPADTDIFERGGALLRDLIALDDWLPDEYARPDPQRYQQYLLHADSAGRFSVVSFVWAPGQTTPVHDHTVWGLIGVLRGAEVSQSYRWDEQGGLVASGAPQRLEAGAITVVAPSVGDIHSVSNASSTQPSVSVHVYGANIGGVRRSVYPADGARKLFISGYSNTTLPNIWDVSRESAQ